MGRVCPGRGDELAFKGETPPVRCRVRFGLDVLVGHLIADRQLVTALGATTSQDSTAIFGRHAGTEPVLVDSFPIAGLERSFHDGKSILDVRGSI